MIQSAHDTTCPKCGFGVTLTVLGPPILGDGLFASTIMMEHPKTVKCLGCGALLHAAVASIDVTWRAEAVDIAPEPLVKVPGR